MIGIVKTIVDKPGIAFFCALEFGGDGAWILCFQETIIENYGSSSLILVKCPKPRGNI